MSGAPGFPEERRLPLELTKRALIRLGTESFLLGLIIAALGAVIHTWPRWMFFGIAGLFLSMAADFFLRLLPQTRLREITRSVVALPAEFIGAIANIGGALLNIGLALALLYFVLLASFVLINRIASGYLEPGPAHVYLAILSTLVIAGYSGDRVLWPIKWMNIIGRGRGDQVVESGLLASVRIIRLIDFRRLAYLLSIFVYITQVAMSLAGTALRPEWSRVMSIALEALLTFLGIDAYVSAFHPRLLAPRKPLSYEVRRVPWGKNE